jgi:hypothetical protein
MQRPRSGVGGIRFQIPADSKPGPPLAIVTVQPPPRISGSSSPHRHPDRHRNIYATPQRRRAAVPLAGLTRRDKALLRLQNLRGLGIKPLEIINENHQQTLVGGRCKKTKLAGAGSGRSPARAS